MTESDTNIFRITETAPRLVVTDATSAIDFYQRVWGATVNERFTSKDGKVVHSKLTIGPATVTVKDADGADPVSRPGPLMSLHFDDVDAAAAAFLDAGGTVIFPVADQPYGARAGRLADPFGVQWMVSQVVEDLSHDEVQAMVDQM